MRWLDNVVMRLDVSWNEFLGYEFEREGGFKPSLDDIVAAKGF